MIYGHMMYDETVFGPLRNYQRKKLFKENNALHSGQVPCCISCCILAKNLAFLGKI